MTMEAENSSVTHAMDRQEDRWEASPALSAPELHVSADRGVCLFVCALTHSRVWERETASVLPRGSHM